MATHSSVLAWRIPWTEKPGRLQSMGSHRVGHDWSDLAAAAAAMASLKFIVEFKPFQSPMWISHVPSSNLLCTLASPSPLCSSHVLVAQSRPTLCDPLWTLARQAPLSTWFSRQEYWSGLAFPSPVLQPHWASFHSPNTPASSQSFSQSLAPSWH